MPLLRALYVSQVHRMWQWAEASEPTRPEKVSVKTVRRHCLWKLLMPNLSHARSPTVGTVQSNSTCDAQRITCLSTKWHQPSDLLFLGGPASYAPIFTPPLKQGREAQGINVGPRRA
eukprot:scaffold47102_cov22-Prasinocladus_malaysianus.AAC.2